ncbi:MAG TPA: ATP-binding protein [Myxococcaceae bacterium]|nr:ATP-binding protein [Myxococcaceae bacterium]
MRLSIRYQIILLVSGLLLGAMAIYLTLATRLLSADTLDTLKASNVQLAATLADEVQVNIKATVDKLLYFGAEQSVEVTRPAGPLMEADPQLLGVEIWARSGEGFARVFHDESRDRLRQLGIPEESLDEARRRYPLDVEQARQAGGILLQNASVPPRLPLLRLTAISPDGMTVVVSDIRPGRLLSAFGHALRRAEAYLVDANGVVLVHPDEGLVLARADRSRDAAVQPALESPGGGGSHEFSGPQGDRLGAWSSVRLGRMFVIVEIPREESTRGARELVRRSVAFALGVLALALVLSVFFARRLAEPLQRLQDKMESISRGDFGVEVEVSSRNEIGTLAAAFNQMSRELATRERALMQANQQLIQSEKLSALGEMSAGLAHEVKNPMVGICGFSELGAHVETLEEAREYFALINADAQRANEILQNLLTFARPEQAALTGVDVNETVRGAVRLVAHQVQIGGVKLVTSYADGLPPVMGSANQLRQVLINLAMNGSHAMDKSETKVLTVSTSLAPEGRVLIEVKDTGHGMSEETLRKLFRPFFTTKPKGQGTGLGLSVSKTIIQQHQGEISVKSVLGQGTTFTVVLPAAIPGQRPTAGGSVAPAA